MSVYQKKKKEPYDQRTAQLTPEEQKLRAENLAAREHMSMDGVNRLCASICLRAVVEYRKMKTNLMRMEAIKNYEDAMRLQFRDPRGRKKTNPDKFEERIAELKEDILDCEDFFNSEMFVNCTGIYGEDAIKKILKLRPEALTTIERRLEKG